jgi:septum formation protein
MAARSEPIILASASAARAALLRAAGVDFVARPAAVDEALLKREMRLGGGSALDCAAALAEAKAQHISNRHPEALVVGADQLLAIGSEWFDKPGDLAAARAQLLILRGRTHALASAVCVACAGVVLWHVVSVPEMTMRRFSDAFIDAYIAAEGDALLGSVGAYRLEGRGAQLFSRITGDHFAVLGLPLIELLGFLRQRGAILS